MILKNTENLIHKTIKLFEKYSVYLSPFGLVFGLIISPLTLTRIDNSIQDLFIILQIFLVTLGIVILNYLENRKIKGRISIEKHGAISFWFIFIIQFLFGNLFSAYIVFYFMSSTLSVSWPFILLILALLIGNEIWRKHYSRLTLQISTLFLAVYMFFIFYLPIIVNRIGDDVFIYSGLCSIFFIFILILVLWRFTRENFIKSKKALLFSLGGILFIMNLMYFLNIMPPIPLSLKNAGIYHSISKDNSINYILEVEKKNWMDYFKFSETYHRYNNEPVYVFSSIFSPTKFDTQIIHKWKYYDKNSKKWIGYSQIKLPTIGGRDGGYRTYSNTVYAQSGLWRVDVVTLKGRLIGRVNFEIIDVKEKPVVEYVSI